MLELAALLLLQTSDARTFQNELIGFRLKYPAEWETARTAAPTLLRLLKTKNPLPEIAVIHERRNVPLLLAQYQEQLAKEGNLTDAKELSFGSRKALQATIEIKGESEKELVVLKTAVAMGLRRFLVVTAVCPKPEIDAVRKTYDYILSSLEFFPAREREGIAEGLARFEELRRKIAPKPVAVDRREELEILLDDALGTKLGSYVTRIVAAKKDGAEGYEVESSIQIQMKDGPKTEFSSKGFISADLSRQTLEHRNVTNDAGKIREYSVTASINTGLAQVVRILDGVKSEATFQVPEGTIFTEFVEWLQWRVLELGTVGFHVRTLSTYDEHTEPVEIEAANSGRAKPDDAFTVVVTSQEGNIMNYTYSREGTITRSRGRSFSGIPQASYMRAKKS
jgi:hypothetical protein